MHTIRRLAHIKPSLLTHIPRARLSTKPRTPNPHEPNSTIRSANRLLVNSSTLTKSKPYTESEYKWATIRWTTLIVSLPIVIVTSYWVYERVVLGKKQKDIEELRRPPVDNRGLNGS